MCCQHPRHVRHCCRYDGEDCSAAIELKPKKPLPVITSFFKKQPSQHAPSPSKADQKSDVRGNNIGSDFPAAAAKGSSRDSTLADDDRIPAASSASERRHRNNTSGSASQDSNPLAAPRSESLVLDEKKAENERQEDVQLSPARPPAGATSTTVNTAHKSDNSSAFDPHVATPPVLLDLTEEDQSKASAESTAYETTPAEVHAGAEVHDSPHTNAIASAKASADTRASAAVSTPPSGKNKRPVTAGSGKTVNRISPSPKKRGRAGGGGGGGGGGSGTDKKQLRLTSFFAAEPHT